MNAINDIKLIQKFEDSMRGVFSINDLRNLFNQDNDVLLYRRIREFEKSKVLKRFKQGFYLTSNYDPEALACRIYPEAYISLGNVLSKKLLIGSIPQKTIYAIRAGRNRLFQSDEITIVYLGISKDLIFGTYIENGITYATAEKAFLDTLYFYQKGTKFSFNIFQDIDLTQVDKPLILKWLNRYKNPRFVSFVEGVLKNED